MRIATSMCLCTTLAAAPQWVAAQAYRCTAPDGSITLQQVPCAGGTKLDVARPLPPTARESRVAAAIALRQVFIGMTDQEVLRSWGRPDSINRSVSTSGVNEQWVYDRGGVGRGQYLYMEDGTLRSLQTSR